MSSLTLQLTKVKSLKTKKINTLRKTIERFEKDQNNLELWKALQSSKEVFDDNGDAYEILMEACISKMHEELEVWDKQSVSPLVAKLDVAESDLGAYLEDKDRLESKYFKLAGSFHERQKAENTLVAEKSRLECKPDTKKVKSAEAIKPAPASLKLLPSEFQIWAVKAAGWVQESNFMLSDVSVQHLYLNAIIDKEIQLKIEALPEYVDADALEIIKLVEKVHNAANPLFVKRSSFYAAHRNGGETESTYIARVRVLADLAKIADMDHKEHVKFKVLTDLRVKVREKVLRDPDMTLDDMTILVADVEAMDIVNNSLKHDQP